MSVGYGQALQIICASLGALLFASVAPHASYAQVSGKRSVPLCWTSEELSGKQYDKKIHKGIPSAYVPPPKDIPNQLMPVLRKMRGAIRRVGLPPKSPKYIALTFDMCEQPYEIAGYDGSIVDILRREEVRATFFAGGKWMLTHPTRAKQLMTDPLFEVGNHTWEHRNLRLVSEAILENEISAPQVVYEKLRSKLLERRCLTRDGKILSAENPKKSMTLFRFPFGACNQESLNAVNDAGLLAIQWDVSSNDPSFSVSPDHMARIVLRGVKPGSIVLFHGNGRGWHTAEALKEIIPRLRQLGYHFVTVSQLINAPGARLDIRPICFDERPGDTNRYDDLARRLEQRFQKFTAKYASDTERTSFAERDNKDDAWDIGLKKIPLPERVIKTTEAIVRGNRNGENGSRKLANLPSRNGQNAKLQVPMGAKSFEPGAKFKDCAACPTMVVIPNGNFMMGWRDIFDGTESPYSEEDSLHKLTYSEEGPPHKVTIAKAFAVGRTHITRGEFSAFVEATGYTANGGCNTRIGEEWKLNSRYSWLSPGFVQDDSHPVVCVSWEDAKAYTKWLSEHSGKTYRLMSEAEEEYIARGNATLNTKQTHYFFGNRKEKLCVYANVADKTYGTKFNSEAKKVAPCRDDYVFTAPVAHFKPNAFGLYDIHGNVNTWTEDCWDGGSSLVPVDGSAWSEEGCKRRVFRGGSWSSIPLYLHITSRFARMPNYRGDYIGFRVARTLE